MLIQALALAVALSAPLFQDGREKEMHDLERRVAELEERMKVAKEKGDADEAGAVAKELETVLRRVKELRMGPPPKYDKDLGQAQERLAELRKRLAEAEAAGQKDVAEKLRAELQQMERKLAESKERRMGERPPMQGRPGMPPPGRDPEGRRREFEELLPAIKELDPGILERIEQFKREGRHEDAMRLMEEAIARTRELRELKERDPEGFKLQQDANAIERQAEDLGAKLRRIPADRREERDAAKAQLKDVVGKLFDVREKLRGREVEELKRRVAELQDLLKKRQEARDRIIERRLRQLSGEPDELDW